MGNIHYRPGMYRYVHYRFRYYVQQCTGYNEDGSPKFETVNQHRSRDLAISEVYRLNGWKLKERTNG